jgi:hypothetical protein
MRGGYRGGHRGGLRGGFRGGYRGGFRGGFAGGAERTFNQDVYADYSGPDQQMGGGLRMDGGGYHGGAPAYSSSQPYGADFALEPSQQIMVRNVSSTDRVMLWLSFLTVYCGCDSYLGLQLTKISWSCLRRLAKLNKLRFCLKVPDPKVLV